MQVDGRPEGGRRERSVRDPQGSTVAFFLDISYRQIHLSCYLGSGREEQTSCDAQVNIQQETRVAGKTSTEERGDEGNASMTEKPAADRSLVRARETSAFFIKKLSESCEEI